MEIDSCQLFDVVLPPQGFDRTSDIDERGGGGSIEGSGEVSSLRKSQGLCFFVLGRCGFGRKKYGRWRGNID